MKIRMHKPGQLLTINRKVYRIKQANDFACRICDAWDECFTLETIKGKMYNVCNAPCTGTPDNCYLQLVVPKSSSNGKS